MMAAKSTQPSSQPAIEPADVSSLMPTANGSLPAPDGVGVDKIRDLLFGNQMQDYDRRFAKLEERFLQRFKDIEAETSRNLSAFESNAKKQIESLASQLREEKDVRADGDKEIERSLREQNQTLEKRLRSVSDQLSQLERDTADRLTQEAHALREEIKRKNGDIQHAIEKMFAELSNVKTDRNLLAGLFVEVAKALNQDMGLKNTSKGSEPLHGWPNG
jgi:DNA repair exonuclease SbcCD ATPase subunit